VSDKLLGQFVDCLEARVGPPASTASAPPEPTGAESADTSPAAVPAEGSAGSAEATRPIRPLGEGAASMAPRVQAAGAIDLGTTVLPALARAYWKPLAGLLLVLLALRWWRRR
jgi:hypothetical protein